MRTAPLFPAMVLAVALPAAASTFARPAHADSDDPQRMAEVGIGTGYVYRRATTSSNANPGRVAYGGSIGIDVHGRAYITPWLRIAMYYLAGHESVEVPHGPGTPYDQLSIDSAWAFSLGGRLEPTWQVTDRFRAFAIVGAGWGRMKTYEMRMASGSLTYEVDPRAGVWVECPMGLGATFDIWPRRLGLSFESTIAPHTSQSGTLFAPVQYIDSQGRVGHVPPMPTLSTTLATMLNVVVVL